MSFILPSDDELRRLFSLLDEKDIKEMTAQFDADVAHARVSQIQNLISIDGGNSFSFSSISKPNTSSVRGSVSSSEEYTLPKFSNISLSSALVETTVDPDSLNCSELENTRAYTKAA
ncbi:hypothetical protein [Lacticaseibacillus paracasei]|uniref:hypothetical protein n=1 Tax=Lacticaseibacillus paracasei TaxID=1597 RepID=UPI004045AA8F